MAMEIDTGAAALPLMSEVMFHELWADRSVDSSIVKLCSYLEKLISVVGTVEVTLRSRQQVANVAYR